MGDVRRKTITRPLPRGAETFTQGGKHFGRWVDGRTGKSRTAPLTESGTRIRVQTATFTARYRDAEGRIREVATGCRSRKAAERILAELEERVERIVSGIVTPDEDRVIDRLEEPVEACVDTYVKALARKTVRGRRVSPDHVSNVVR